MNRSRNAEHRSTLQLQLEALDSARKLAAARLDDARLEKLQGVLDRAGSRRSLSADHTVVGVFGPTGSGKSSLINALSGTSLARVAARRPTTSSPLALVWGPAGSAELLDWLSVEERHDMPADSALSGEAGLILLDLPDFDSTASAHRLVVERMAGQVDVLLWVVDPQKYADAALHQGFLAPLASHEAVTLVALNQSDRLDQSGLAEVTASLSGILAAEGLGRVSVFPVSARTGAGLGALTAAVRTIVTRKGVFNERLAADVAAAAAELVEFTGPGDLALPGASAQAGLAEGLADAAGVGAVVDAVVASHRRDAHAATGWPVTRWLSALRPDPLRRLNLRRTDLDPMLRRTSLPTGEPAQRAKVDRALRTYADTAAGSAVEPWRSSIRNAARSSVPGLMDGLDQAVAGTDLATGRRSWWWPVAGVLQWVAFAALVAGAAWLGLLALGGFLQLQLPQTPRVEGFPVPTLLIVAGAGAGILLAVLSAVLARFGAMLRGRRARRRLSASVTQVAADTVVEPVAVEISRYNAFRAAVAASTRQS
ncbi:GTP-binding protein EngB required for normal cell division [Arthrobacter sp. CAN_A214]|uniref:GTPase n=1 Tax=Arthrobacter sp. CAN_A214 TaxID=2787720 RepID=UPI0018C9C965